LDEDLLKSKHEKISDYQALQKVLIFKQLRKGIFHFILFIILKVLLFLLFIDNVASKSRNYFLRLFQLFNEADAADMNLDANLIEKAIQLADLVPEHKIIEDVKVLKAKYMYNALKLQHHQRKVLANETNFSITQNNNTF
jgi:hypothetical protein